MDKHMVSPSRLVLDNEQHKQKQLPVSWYCPSTNLPKSCLGAKVYAAKLSDWLRAFAAKMATPLGLTRRVCVCYQTPIPLTYAPRSTDGVTFDLLADFTCGGAIAESEQSKVIITSSPLMCLVRKMKRRKNLFKESANANLAQNWQKRKEKK